MSDTSQIALIRKLYAAMRDVNSFKSLLADDVEWDIGWRLIEEHVNPT
jgi:hypothetical protein